MTLDLTIPKPFLRVILRVFLRKFLWMLQLFVLVEDPSIFHGDKLPCGECWYVLCVYYPIVNI